MNAEKAELIVQETKDKISSLEAEIAALTGKDNKKARNAKSKQLSKIKNGADYIDAIRVLRGEEPTQKTAEEGAEKARLEEEAARIREEEVRIATEQAAEQARQEEEAARIREEEAAEKARQDEEAARLREEEAAEKARQEEEAARIREEEAAEKARLEEEAVRIAEEKVAEKARQEEEAARIREDEAAKKANQEGEAARIREEKVAEKVRQEEEAARLREEKASEKARQEEEAARIREEAAAKKARQDEEVARIAAEAEVKKKPVEAGAGAQVVVLGGGLSGVSAANTVLENSGRVTLLDKSAFCGGNSSKATSGINGANTRAQRNKQITDSTELFISDTKKGGAKKPDLVEVLCANSGSDVEWLMDTFALDLSLVARLGGHSQPRTHRGKERFPGMTITYALIQMLENVAENNPDKARIITKAQANKLIMDDAGVCVGCRYLKDGSESIANGPVIICTGGFGADFTQDSLLAQHRPDLLHLPTTNGMHCTGDGIKMGMEIGASTIDLEWVQVHPTGLVKPDEPDAKIKFLAAEALRGVGGLVLDANGKRFCNELGRRDYVTGEMWKNTPPFRLVLNYAASEEIIWHCKHYTGRGVMKMFESGEALAKEMGIDVSVLENTHAIHYEAAKKTEADPDGGPFPAYPSGRSWDEPSGKTNSGKKFYHNIIDASAVRTQRFYAAVITPVIHYCMGGLEINTDSLVTMNGKAIPGLYAAGEVAGGVHGNNRLGGNSLLDCVVFGRVAGKHAVKYLLGSNARPVSLSQISGNVAAVAEKAPVPVKAEVYIGDGYSMEEVQKHNSNTDCWVVLHGRVLNVTSFLKEHPGGELAIMTFAGKDATKEFDMIHPAGVVEKYAPHAVIGKLAVEATAPAAASGGQAATTAAGVPPGMSRLLIVGGSFAGLCVGRDMKSRFHVTIVDAKEYFEYTPGILRAYVKPKHFDALTFTLAPVIERRMGCKFIWGEVMAIDGHARTATVKPMFLKTTEVIDFDYCVIAAGCNFGPFHPCGQSLWFPTVQQEYREKGDWVHIDERYIEGRRRHLLEEYNRLSQLEAKSATILIVGMGFIGVEWATEIKHFFPQISITMCDMAPNCLGPLPKSAATYCEKYLKRNNIHFYYETGYAPKDQAFWNKIELPNKADYEYICVGVKASNTFMPEETLTERGKWIGINKFLAVITRENEVWSYDGSDSRVYAIGDCNAACVGQRDSGEVNARGQKIFAYDINPIPKISYPGEEEAVIVAKNIKKIDKTNRGVACNPQKGMHWPWGAGWFATSLGPHDACFVSGANWKPGSGGCIVWGGLSAVQKEVIEASKVDECKYGFIGRCIWHFVHHTPLHLFGGGPKFGY